MQHRAATLAHTLTFLLTLLATGWCSSVPAAEPQAPPLADLLQDLAGDDAQRQEAAIQQLGETADARALPALIALRLNSLYAWTPAHSVTNGSPRIVIGGKKQEDAEGNTLLEVSDALTDQPILDAQGQPVLAPADQLQKAKVNNALRRLISPVLDRLSLASPNAELRRTAATKLGNEQKPELLPVLREALSTETSHWTRFAIEEAVAMVRLASTTPEERIAAAQDLKRLHAPNGLSVLQTRLAAKPEEGGENSPEARLAMVKAVSSIRNYQDRTLLLGTAFYGISLGAVLMMIALGLAITFGLMGVINMAHGELMLAGAYTTYLTQLAFQAWLPGWFDAYILAAIPASFLVAGLLGMLLEAGVIRHLYGRPMETLLLTWGISLILQQAARHIFGAANVDVPSPSWLTGGWQVMVGLVLPYNRLFILGFSLVCLGGVAFLLQRTPLGLRIRSVTQNREMSACCGIPTRAVDAWTFGLGAGVAGIAGCELSLLGNVGPDLGQTYIIDSFMVVVLGGVGKLLGTVVAAFSIGTVSKVIEPFADAVMGKVLVLVLLVLFLQRRPGGLFPAKGRHAEV